MHKLFAGSLLGLLLFAALPGTANYRLNSYGFGSGGGTGSTSNYALEGKTGEISGQTSATANYKILPAYIGTRQANVPKLTSLDNNGGVYYNKLHFVIDTQGNPTDAKFALEISTDNFGLRYALCQKRSDDWNDFDDGRFSDLRGLGRSWWRQRYRLGLRHTLLG